MKKIINIGIAALSVSLAGCRSAGKEMAVGALRIEKTVVANGAVIAGGNPISTSPIVYVYKTKADYLHQVPVLMDEGRTRILAYPAPSDLKTGDVLCLPTPLEDGYLLDNRGIGLNVAFLAYTYEEYSKFTEPPSMKELMANIVERYPLLEIHECGRRADYKDIVSELNEKISEGFLQK